MLDMKSVCQQVKVVEVCKITPSECLAKDEYLTPLPLTYFDMFFVFSDGPVEQVYYYRFNEPTTAFYGEVVPKLKDSLSHTLFHYFPLAGRLTWPIHEPKPIIINHGTPEKDFVSLTFAECADAGLFDHLSSNEMIEIHAGGSSRALIPKLERSEFESSAVAIQVTLFPNTGFSIGYAIHHGVIDGASISMFMKSWAYICKNNNLPVLPQQLVPSFDRTVIKDPDGLDTFFLNKYVSARKRFCPEEDPRSLKPLNIPMNNLSTKPNHLVQAKFVLTREVIQKLRVWVSNVDSHHQLQSQQQQQGSIHFSSFVLTYAYTLFCLIKSMGEEKVEILSFTVLANLRTRVGSIPENYFGNCVFAFEGRVESKALTDGNINGVWLMAKKIYDLVRDANKGVPQGIKDMVNKHVNISNPKTLVIIANGSPRFDVYGIDFGWGRPKTVNNISMEKDRRLSIESNGDGNGGIEVGVVLEKDEVERFSLLFVDGLKHQQL